MECQELRIEKMTASELIDAIADAVIDRLNSMQKQETRYVRGAKDMAKILGVSERTIQRHIKPTKVGRSNLYDVECLTFKK
jgi:hypothetical protein